MRHQFLINQSQQSRFDEHNESQQIHQNLLNAMGGTEMSPPVTDRNHEIPINEQRFGHKQLISAIESKKGSRMGSGMISGFHGSQEKLTLETTRQLNMQELPHRSLVNAPNRSSSKTNFIPPRGGDG